MIPMRDGVKLYTVIVMPKGATNAPILLTRTPYNAAKRAERVPNASRIVDALPQGDTVFAEDGSVAIEGVLLVSTRENNAVRISRASGVTWADYITFPRPRTGAYYVGSPLMAGVPHSRAIA